MSAPTGTICKCGQPCVYINESRCEDCFADDQQKYDGKSQAAEFLPISEIRETRQTRKKARPR